MTVLQTVLQKVLQKVLVLQTVFQRRRRPRRSRSERLLHGVIMAPILFLLGLTSVFLWMNNTDLPNDAVYRTELSNLAAKQQQLLASAATRSPSVPYQSLRDLTPAERFPRAGPRHMVDPPADTNVTLVRCETTQGPWSLVVHHAWAPRGAHRFEAMVRAGYFGKVPMMRCLKQFICQFGLKGQLDPHERQHFAHTIPDDPPWLPLGPAHRTNERGVKRFAKGYFAYAGAGPDSRDVQLIVALTDVGTLAGGSPWEVPWGELVGRHSFETLDKIYTGYDEHGPSQGSLYQKNALEGVARQFPLLDYILSCKIVDQAEIKPEVNKMSVS